MGLHQLFAAHRASGVSASDLAQICAAHFAQHSVHARPRDALIADPNFHPVKHTARTTVGRWEIADASVFVKCVAEGGWLKGYFARLRGSRARRALRGARLLQAAGFRCPEPLWVGERRTAGAVRASYVVSEALINARMLSTFALDRRRDLRHRRWVSAAVATELRRLHARGLYTRDLQETNLMLEADGAQLRVYFVDLEDFRVRRRVSQAWRLRNLIHLDRSIGRFVNRAGRLRFLYDYLGDRPEPAAARRLLQELAACRARIEHRRRHRLAPDRIAKGAGARPSSLKRGTFDAQKLKPSVRCSSCN